MGAIGVEVRGNGQNRKSSHRGQEGSIETKTEMPAVRLRSV